VAECAVAIRNYIHNPSLLRRHREGVRAMQKLVDIETIADQWLDWMGGITD
jgi:hypothetical protein